MPKTVSKKKVCRRPYEHENILGPELTSFCWSRQWSNVDIYSLHDPVNELKIDFLQGTSSMPLHPIPISLISHLLYSENPCITS
jgi:hypothetical protein